jgi:hypothetical protein
MAEPWEVFGGQQSEPPPAQPPAQPPPASWADVTRQALANAPASQPEPWEAFGGMQPPAAGQPAPAAAQPTPATDQPLAWSDVPGQALRNTPASAGRFARDIAQPFIHPIDTASSLADLGRGILEKTGVVSGDEHVKYADAVGKYFADRYGSIDGIKRALAQDPVGVAGDIAGLVSGGEGLAAKTLGTTSRISRYIDPLTLAGKAAEGAVAGASKVGSAILGAPMGVGAGTLDMARQAGREGGPASDALTSQMRGSAPTDEIVADARNAADALRRERANHYRSGMVDLSKDKTVLDWKDVDNAVTDMNKVNTFKGQSLSNATQAVRDNITGAINNWKGLDPAQYHTPEGFDALKRQIQNMTNTVPLENSAARVVVEQARDAIKNTITKQAPKYDEIMQDYSRASNMIDEATKSLSLGKKSTADAALRKLTSSLRNNVNTNYSQRQALVSRLQDAGAPQLLNKIAGASLSSWTPRGITAGQLTGGLLGAVGTGLATGHLGAGLAAVPLAALTSPRLMGEAFHGVGVGQRYAPLAGTAASAARQIGRIPRVEIDTSTFK